MGTVPLVDLGNYPEINAADVGDFHIIGDRGRFIMYDWYKVNGLWQARIVGTVTRPLASLREEAIKYWREAMHSKAPVEGLQMARH